MTKHQWKLAIWEIGDRALMARRLGNTPRARRLDALARDLKRLILDHMA